PYLTAAVLSSVHRDNLEGLLAGVFGEGAARPLPERLAERVLGVAAALGDRTTLPKLLRKACTPGAAGFTPLQLAALGGVLDALHRRGQSLEAIADAALCAQVRRALARARATATDPKAAEAERLSAARVLGLDIAGRDADLAALGKLLGPQHSPALQSAALAALGRIPDERVAARL